jgi:hypothetical protein
MNKWEYGDAYKKYDMSGEINIGTGIVMVHNIFDPLPNFMLNADIVFCDPPCSMGNINSFYTKAGRSDYQLGYSCFLNRFWEVVDLISPRVLYIEVFKSNSASMAIMGNGRYDYFSCYNTTYYHNKKNACQVLIFSNNYEDTRLNIEGIDEQNAIEVICRDATFSCIADPCMGRGLVGFYANKYDKRFVGTELNEKRLAVLLERINNNKL